MQLHQVRIARVPTVTAEFADLPGNRPTIYDAAMGRRGRKADVYQSMAEPAEAREAIERRWYERITLAPELATQVTAAGSAREPFHRWLHLKHGFSPELVRLFLRDAAGMRGHVSQNPVLDPFSGSGTVVVESSRRGFNALGVEALPPLKFLSNVKFSSAFSELPKLDAFERWEDVAELLIEPLHRAALMLAVARQHTSDGRPIPNARPLWQLMAEVVEVMREDLRVPLPVANRVQEGDARKLEMLADESVSGVITSPPYLSRHDYLEVTDPYSRVYRHWFGDADSGSGKEGQIAAHPKAIRKNRPSEFSSVEIDESCEALRWHGLDRIATVVRTYFDDLFTVVQELQRVLEPGAPCWIVIGGARMKDVCIPSDLILAEFVMDCGFALHDIRQARNLIDVGRKLGKLRSVTPRESVLIMSKA